MEEVKEETKLKEEIKEEVKQEVKEEVIMDDISPNAEQEQLPLWYDQYPTHAFPDWNNQAMIPLTDLVKPICTTVPVASQLFKFIDSQPHGFSPSHLFSLVNFKLILFFGFNPSPLDFLYDNATVKTIVQRSISEYKTKAESSLQTYHAAMRMVYIGSVRGYLSARDLGKSQEKVYGVPLPEIPSRYRIDDIVDELIATVHNSRDEVFETTTKKMEDVLIDGKKYSRDATLSLTYLTEQDRELVQSAILFLERSSDAFQEVLSSDGKWTFLCGFPDEASRDEAADFCEEELQVRPVCHKKRFVEEFHMIPLVTWFNVLQRTFLAGAEDFKVGFRSPSLDLVLWGDQVHFFSKNNYMISFSHPNLSDQQMEIHLLEFD